MATIKIKKSNTAGAVPTLIDGEIAINQNDQILFYRNQLGVLQKFAFNSIYTTIDFGVTPINEKTFNIINANCLPTSKIEIMQFFQNQNEENFGNNLDLFTECLTGSFNIIAVSREPFSRGIFNIKYKLV